MAPAGPKPAICTHHAGHACIPDPLRMSSNPPHVVPSGRKHWLPTSAGRLVRLLVVVGCIAIALLARRVPAVQPYLEK
ncbi:MAG TPA: hypothetical protein PK861_07370, partial [Thermomonas sp.]|nr:hypothetical protein [Thermomonas sp.]